jgi:gluconolactonase
MSNDPAVGSPDGMKVDSEGNIYCTGAGGIWVNSPQGRPLGTIVLPERPSNLAFGDYDGKSLYVTARSGLYRIHVSISGWP